jgi:hypothetical protein
VLSSIDVDRLTIETMTFNVSLIIVVNVVDSIVCELDCCDSVSVVDVELSCDDSCCTLLADVESIVVVVDAVDDVGDGRFDDCMGGNVLMTIFD